MCDICKLIEAESKFINGDREGTNTVKLQKYSPQLQTATFRLCYIHDIEFFVTGERRFIKKYYNFTISNRSVFSTGSSNSLF